MKNVNKKITLEDEPKKELSPYADTQLLDDQDQCKVVECSEQSEESIETTGVKPKSHHRTHACFASILW